MIFELLDVPNLQIHSKFANIQNLHTLSHVIQSPVTKLGTPESAYKNTTSNYR